MTKQSEGKGAREAIEYLMAKAEIRDSKIEEEAILKIEKTINSKSLRIKELEKRVKYAEGNLKYRESSDKDTLERNFKLLERHEFLIIRNNELQESLKSQSAEISALKKELAEERGLWDKLEKMIRDDNDDRYMFFVDYTKGIYKIASGGKGKTLKQAVSKLEGGDEG